MPGAARIQLSIVVPAFNEETRLAGSLEQIRGYCQRRHRRYEVVVADDGSTDGTAPMVRRLMEGWAELRLVTNSVNRGKGYATRRGVLSARGDWILCSDADLSTPIEQLELLLRAGQEHEVVIGSRSIAGARITVHQPFHRELMGRVFNWTVRLLVVPGHADTQCGFKLYRREAARRIFEQLTIEGFAFDVEALYLAHRLGYRVAEVPVVWLNDERSKVRVLSDPPRMFMDVLRIPWRHRRIH
jgi:dolichyl-phosphate beta-glucosyltransferase